MTDLVGLACRLGAVQAMEFVEFRDSIKELGDQQQKMLLRATLALNEFPHEAALERADLLRVITALRQAWLKIKYEAKP